MKKLKYAGLCAAGIAVNFACPLIDWLFCYVFDLFYTVSIGLFIIVGAVLCIGSGFLHVAFMNIIRKRLMMSSKWYFLTVFAALVVLCGLGIILTFAFSESICAGWDGLGKAMTLFFFSIGIGGVAIVSGISTLCIQPLLGVAEPDKGEERDQ